ncbi:MAG: hypothetical protein ACYC1U_07280 [Candidatus Aquicultorales bacterium]
MSEPAVDSLQPDRTPANSKDRMSQLKEDAKVIVRAQITSVNSEWNSDRSNIYTYVGVTVRKVFKGASVPQEISIKQLGGKVGDSMQYVVDLPQFAPGEDLIVFLKPRELDAQGKPKNYMVVGLADGKLKVGKDAVSGREVVTGGALSKNVESVVEIETLLHEDGKGG